MNAPISRYPLQWPAGWPRTPAHRRGWAKFAKKRTGGFGSDSLSIADGLGRVLGELSRMGVRDGDVVISTNVPTRLDGLPRSDQGNPADPGVAVYWRKKDATKVMAIDHYARVADNLAAVAATLDAMRAIERHGGAAILDRAFVGFEALPAPGNTAARSWREVLEIAPGVRPTLDEISQAYRRLASKAHPDKGGTDAAMAELNAARAQAEEAIR